MKVIAHEEVHEFWGGSITHTSHEIAEDYHGEIKEKVKELVRESFSNGETIPLFYEIEVEGHSFYLYPEDELTYREFKELLEENNQ